MEGCEPLTGYILRQIAKPLVEGGVGITAIDGRGIRRGCQETEPKRINEIEKTKHVPRRNETSGLVRRSRISKTHNRCQEAYDGVAQASG